MIDSELGSKLHVNFHSRNLREEQLSVVRVEGLENHLAVESHCSRDSLAPRLLYHQAMNTKT